MSLTVVIPALNEEDGISITVADIRATLQAAGIIGFEVIVVDDGSSDRTKERAQAEGAKVVSHVHNLGYGRSLKTGIENASHDTIVITDADGTYPIKDIPRLLETYNRGFDMIVAQRTGMHYQESAVKAPLRRLLQKIVEFLAERPVLDVNSGLRVFSKKTVSNYTHRLCNTFSFTTSMTLAYMMNGKTVIYVPSEYNARIGKTKVKLIKDSIKTFQYIMQAAIYYNPLRLFVFFSFLTTGLGILAMIGSLLGGGVTSLFSLGIGSFLLSIIIFAFGLIADLIKQGFDELARKADR